MGFLGFGKKRDVVDLGEHYRKHQKVMSQVNSSSETSSSTNSDTPVTPFGIFGNNTTFNSTPSDSNSNDYVSLGDENSSATPGEKKRRLAKRLLDMTNKIEDLSNQIYHLQQRIEVLERKNDVSRY